MKKSKDKELIEELGSEQSVSKSAPLEESSGDFDNASENTDAFTAESGNNEAENGSDEDKNGGDGLEDMKLRLELLRAELEEKNAELEKKNAELAFITSESEEFSSLFPNVSPKEIPNEVWETARRVGSLAAAYALFHRKEELKAQKAKQINDQNALRSAGEAGKSVASEYYSPDEVKRMSPSEIRSNYSRIIESMKKWN